MYKPASFSFFSRAVLPSAVASWTAAVICSSVLKLQRDFFPKAPRKVLHEHGLPVRRSASQSLHILCADVDPEPKLSAEPAG